MVKIQSPWNQNNIHTIADDVFVFRRPSLIILDGVPTANRSFTIQTIAFCILLDLVIRTALPACNPVFSEVLTYKG